MAKSTERYFCCVCWECSHLYFQTFARYLIHLRNNHCYEPNFKVTCPIEGCFRSYSKIKSLTSHLLRKHKVTESHDDIGSNQLDVSHVTLDSTDGAANDDQCHFGNTAHFNHNEMKENTDPEDISVKVLALYALKTQELNNLSDNATDRVLESTSQLLQQSEENLKKPVRICLQNSGINVRDIDGLEDVLQSPPNTVEAMKQLKTSAERNKYLRNNLRMVVSNFSMPILSILPVTFHRVSTIFHPANRPFNLL